MKDQFGRNITYLRISVTDRCNLRCIYCMPEKGICQVPHQDILTFEEMIRIVEAAAELGITRVRLTGGEPLVRKDVAFLAEQIRKVPGIEETALTTNGILLKDQLKELVQAGITSVNISLDTLDRKRYAAITGRDLLDQALEGLRLALETPELKVKVNCVPLRGWNEEEWVKLALLARDSLLDVRFIEMMPLGMGKKFPVCSQEEVAGTLRRAFGREKLLPPDEGRQGQGPGVYMRFPGFKGRIGFISAMSHQFCGRCNRIRLTADGFLKPCLQYAEAADLRRLLREGADQRTLKDRIRQTIYEKPACHHFGTGTGEEQDQRDMFRIGG